MRLIIGFIALSLTISSWAAKEPVNSVFKVNTAKSVVNWKGSKIGEDHSGVVNISSGTLKFADGILAGGHLMVDMRTIKSTDIENLEYRAKLDNHLKSADFFEVESHPKSLFTFSKVKDMGNGQYSITGEMKIKGVSKEETFVTKVNLAGEKLVAVADVKIDRTKYGIMYKAKKSNEDEWFFTQWFKSGKDKIINNELEIRLNVVADKQTVQ